MLSRITIPLLWFEASIHKYKTEILHLKVWINKLGLIYAGKKIVLGKIPQIPSFLSECLLKQELKRNTALKEREGEGAGYP